MKQRPDIIISFIHLKGPLKGQEQSFSEDEISIGRLPTCHVKYPPDLTCVSREHAKIIRDGNRFKLVDNQSKNGSFVNGKEIKEVLIAGEKIRETYIKHGDTLMFAQDGPSIAVIIEKTEQESEKIHLEGEPLFNTHPPKGDSLPRPVPPYSENIQSNNPPQPIQEIPIPQPPPLPDDNIQTDNPVPPPEPVQNVTPKPVTIPCEKVKVPFLILFGANVSQHNELPLIIGSGSNCNIILNHPEILDQHVQILFYQNQYWIKDLTGRNMISIDNIPVKSQAQLVSGSRLSLSQGGPHFQFNQSESGGQLLEDQADEPLPPFSENEQPDTEEKDDKKENKRKSWFKKSVFFL